MKKKKNLTHTHTHTHTQKIKACMEQTKSDNLGILGCTNESGLNVSYNLINVTSYNACNLPILQNFCFLHNQMIN